MVDYAGLFPPAKLDMATTVANYAEYVKSRHNWMLARLIIPIGRIDEFEKESLGHLPTDLDEMPWMISALVDPLGEGDLEETIETIIRFNESHRAPARGLALIDTIETKANAASMIDDALERLPDGLSPFFEIPSAGDPRGMIAALAGTVGRAKIRTGGVAPEAIPLTRDVLGFIQACKGARVPFKATAGLHHPIRKMHPLTYEKDAPVALMHGFINVFFASAAIFSDSVDDATAAAILDEQDPTAFTFTDGGAAWQDLLLDDETLALAREEFVISFGSCSFTEPVEDLMALKLI